MPATSDLTPTYSRTVLYGMLRALARFTEFRLHPFNDQHHIRMTWAAWAGLVVLQQLTMEKGFPWKEGKTTKRRNLKPLIERIPEDYRQGLGFDIPAAIRDCRTHAKNALRECYWVPNRDGFRFLVGGALEMVNGSFPSVKKIKEEVEKISAGRRLDLGEHGYIDAATFSRLVRQLRLGEPKRTEHGRGCYLYPWRIHQEARIAYRDWANEVMPDFG